MKNTISRTKQKEKREIREEQRQRLTDVQNLVDEYFNLKEEHQESKITSYFNKIQKNIDSCRTLDEKIKDFKQEMKKSSEIVIISRG